MDEIEGSGRLILLNLIEEERISQYECSIFTNSTVKRYKKTRDPILSLRETIIRNGLTLLLPVNPRGITEEGFHFVSRDYLIKEGYIESASDERPPKEIHLHHQLGLSKGYIWATFQNSVNLKRTNAIDIRNKLGLYYTKGDYLYCFPVSLKEPVYIPSTFDAFAEPPYRPTGKDKNWGISRNLVDDSPGLPEVLVLPLMAKSEFPVGYLVEPVLDVKPEGWIAERIKDLMSNPQYLGWKNNENNTI